MLSRVKFKVTYSNLCIYSQLKNKILHEKLKQFSSRNQAMVGVNPCFVGFLLERKPPEGREFCLFHEVPCPQRLE